MKSLRSELKISKRIYKIHAKDIEEAIIKSFRDDKYKFYLNSELIDINNRFRIFEFNDKKYIIKKSPIKEGTQEQSLATVVSKKINDKKIGKFTLKVLLPTLKVIDDNSYIITEYKGVTLQECLYTKNVNNSLLVDDIKNILCEFLKLGILYRGFLPRNTIVVDDVIYLLDLEDTIILDDKASAYINKLWETNFLLNWSYLYDFEDLKNILKKYEGKKNDEPDLIKYENKFGKWINSKLDGLDLRIKIMETVLSAEQKIDLNDNSFCIPPNDMAHLVSDIFNSDIDVLFDITSYVIRKYDSDSYKYLLKELSKLIVDLYKKDENIGRFTIKNILNMIEFAASKCEKKKLEDFILIKVLNDEVRFKNELEKEITKLIGLYNERKEEKVEVDALCEYIISLVR